MGSYVPNTLEERQEMLKEIGYSSIEDLFAHIPDEVKIKGGLNIPEGKSELEVRREMENIASKNQVFKINFKRKSADSIYTVSGRDQSGNLTVHFRVSDNDL